MQSGLILIIDDEQGVRTVLTMTLERSGFRVLNAEDGRAGIRLFGERCAEIGAVLLDLTLPDMKGEEVFRALQRIRPGAPVILMSGYTQQEATGRFTSAKPAAFLQKPYQPAELIGVIRRIVEGNAALATHS